MNAIFTEAQWGGLMTGGGWLGKVSALVNREEGTKLGPTHSARDT